MALIIDFNASKKEIQEFKQKALLQDFERTINIQAPDLIPNFTEHVKRIIESNNFTNQEKIEEIKKKFIFFIGFEYKMGMLRDD